MKRSNRWTAAVLAAGISLAILPATGAHASSEGRRNTAWATTAAAGYMVYRYAQKPSTERAVPAAAAAGVAGVAWSNYSKKRRQEREQERASYTRYGSYRTAGYKSQKARNGHKSQKARNRECRR